MLARILGGWGNGQPVPRLGVASYLASVPHPCQKRRRAPGAPAALLPWKTCTPRTFLLAEEQHASAGVSCFEV